MNIDLLNKRIEALLAALKDLEGVYVHDITKFLDGQLSVSKRTNKLKLPVCLPASEILERPDDLRALQDGLRLKPYILLVSAEPIEPT